MHQDVFAKESVSGSRLSFEAREWLRQLERHPEEYVSFFMDLAPRAKLFDAIVVDTTLGQDFTLKTPS